MKKLFLAAIALTAAYSGMAQKPWELNLNYLNYADSPRLGTRNTVPLEFYTDNVKRMSIEPDGSITMPSIATLKGEHLLSIDEVGNLRPVGGGRVYYCNSTIPWYLGGNQQSPYNDIGTCDNQDFLLKANNRKMIYIKSSDPYIGIGPGNSAPYGTLDITDGNNGAQGVPDHTRIYGDNLGTIESTGALNFIANDGFGYGTGSYANGFNTKFVILPSGNVGINTGTPGALLDARASTNAELRVYSTSTSNSPSKVWVMNHLNSYNLGIDAAGTGHIGDNINSGTPHYLINFKQGSGGVPRVWIGDKAGDGTNIDALFSVYGKMLAKEIVVSTSTWVVPDYVFARGYKLRSLEDVEAYYSTNSHLPEIPSASEIGENGMNLAEMNLLLLKKVEELTLYAVDQHKQLEQLSKEVSDLKKERK